MDRDVASLGGRVRLVDDFKIRGHSNRHFEIGQILTKEDVDRTPGYPYDPTVPGFFESLVDYGVAVPI